MERERLARLVNAPETVGREDLAGLIDLAERYPWFAGAQFLRSVGEHQLGEVRSEEDLRTTAAHLPSRTVLFDRIHVPTLPPLSVVPKEEAVPEASGPVLPPADPTPAEMPVEQPPLEPVLVEADDVLPEETADPLAISAEPPAPEPDPLDLQIRQAAMATGYDLTALPPLDVEPKLETALVMQREEPAPEAPAGHTGGRRSFMDWINGAPVAQGKPQPTEGSVAPSISADWLRALASDTVAPSGTAATAKAPPRAPSETMDLIDRFIRQQEPPPPPKVEFYTPQQAGKRSLDDSGGLVTETLAKVYVKQGNLPKAIATYHKLALKYPEKSAFFAALAKELEVQQHK